MTSAAPPADGTADDPSGVAAPVHSTIPARIDRMPWTRFHTKMVAALGAAWILDGLEITVASSVVGVLTEKDTLNLSSGDAGLIATVYLIGQVTGALYFGRLADRLGRRKLFLMTFGIYLFGSGLTALTMGQGTGWDLFLFATRFVAGMGIGGEYAAINSAIQEMVPARYRGRTDLLVNGTYWAGSLIGTVAELYILSNFPQHLAWRIGFLLGPVLGLAVFFIRRHLPESPRWLVMHGREEEAEAAIAQMEKSVEHTGHHLELVPESAGIDLREAPHIGYPALLRMLLKEYPKRAVLAASLLITQSFLYNAIFFTYTLVLTKFYGVDSARAPIYLIAFAIGNLAGPLALGPLFDTVGRRKMISGTYLIAGSGLIVSAILFQAGVLTAATQTIAWCVIFFFASAGASAGYLTAGEIFPLEVRSRAIAIFFAIGQLVGSTGPFLYGWLIGDGTERSRLFLGYLLGAAVMIIGGLVELFLGVDAEGKSLEDVASPLAAVKRAVVDKAPKPRLPRIDPPSPGAPA